MIDPTEADTVPNSPDSAVHKDEPEDEDEEGEPGEQDEAEPQHQVYEDGGIPVSRVFYGVSHGCH